MAESSYYPLTPLKYSVEGTTSPSPDQPFKDLPHPADTQFQRSPSTGRPPLWRTIRVPLEMALFPLFAIGYLAFCYTVHGRVVPVNTYGLYSVTPQHLATIKGGITSISIIVISIALYPIKDVVASLKSEEFFRVLASHGHGVPLETINHVSTPSFGNVNMMMAMWKHRCSNYYIQGMIASLLIWIVGTLAPGALTVDSVLADGGLMAFAIGAVPPQSVLNGSTVGFAFSNATSNSASAASIAWAEMELGVQYSFSMAGTSEPGYSAFIAPVPVNLATTTSARWLSDVIGMNPTCSWAATNLTAPLPIVSNSSELGNIAAVSLPDFNLDIQLTETDIIANSPFATVKDPNYYVTNHTTQALPSDGSTVFLLGQCQSGSGCPFAASFVDLTLDLSGVGNTFTVAATNQTWIMAALVCTPNITIETREVRNDGHGLLSVQPLSAGGQLTRQGNLNPTQATGLFSVVTISLTQTSGQVTGTQGDYNQLGSQVQADLLFGKAQIASLPGYDAAPGTLATISPSPIENITQGYTQVLQSAAKPYLAGYLGTAYVPGRISNSELVFAASIPNLAVSTGVFALLAALIVVAHFRQGKGFEFTLVNVAAAVHGSELPAQFAGAAYGQRAVEAGGDPEMDSAVRTGKVRPAEGSPDGQQDIMAMYGERMIFMQRRADGSPVLHMG